MKSAACMVSGGFCGLYSVTSVTGVSHGAADKYLPAELVARFERALNSPCAVRLGRYTPCVALMLSYDEMRAVLRASNALEEAEARRDARKDALSDGWEPEDCYPSAEDLALAQADAYDATIRGW